MHHPEQSLPTRSLLVFDDETACGYAKQPYEANVLGGRESEGSFFFALAATLFAEAFDFAFGVAFGFAFGFALGFAFGFLFALTAALTLEAVGFAFGLAFEGPGSSVAGNSQSSLLSIDAISH